MSRTTRYEGLLPVEALKGSKVMIVGVGAGGRQVAVQLAVMGVGGLCLVDYDQVEEVNLGTQGWGVNQVGLPKVEACRATLRGINPLCRVTVENRAFCDQIAPWPVLFCCVDSMQARKRVFEAWASTHLARSRPRDVLFLDARMAAGSCRVLSVADEDDATYYRKEALFGDEEALQEGCTTRGTFYGAYIDAGLLVSEWARWLRGKERLRDFLFSFDMGVSQVLHRQEKGAKEN
ncbi:MAG TPA: ThiF family adenylyltransferase [Bacillota bacterium]|nr:ThiF family adenylyltransferase [Bacillota bacterium]HQD86477.1 ThiF family adenylyltransferase [Bacillota bacterium]